MVFYGWRQYGRVKVEGGLAVATMFFHLFWVPLVPYRGAIMVNKDQGVKSSLRMRSVFVGYGKVWGPLLVAVAFVLGTNLSDSPGAIGWAVSAGVAGALLTGIGYAPQLSTLDGARAVEIHEELQSLISAKSPPSPGTEQ